MTTATLWSEGKVVGMVDGNGLSKTAVRLRRASGVGRTLSTETDEKGKFSFPKVEPGLYWLSGERTGYAPQYYNARSGTGFGAIVRLQAGDEVKDLLFKLTPNVVISGKVLDEDGDPMGRAMVTAMRYVYRTSGRQLQTATTAQTGAIGEYSMSVPPGRYFLRVAPTPNAVDMVAKPATDAPDLAYSATYYPNVADEAGAVPVDGGAGAELRGIDIRMLRVKAFRVRGKVVDGTPAVTFLQLVPKTGVNTPFPGRISRVQPDKTFEFPGVTPGSYHLIGMADGETRVSPQLVLVADRHVNGLALSLAPLGELKGTLTIEGDEKTSRNGILVGFDSYENGTNPQTRVGEDGKFSIKIPLPDRYHPWVANWPGNTYVKSIQYGGRDVKDEALDLTEGVGGPIEIVLAPHGADVSGVVTDADGKPVAGATVVLLPDNGEYLRHWSRNTDDQGAFRLPGVQPGDYKVLAWEDIIYLAWFDKDFLKPFMAKSVVLSVREDDHKTLRLKVIPAGAEQR